jgi:riboflavin transporter FmnP
MQLGRQEMKLNTKTIAVIIIFSAFTIALNLAPIKIPAPYAPFLIYQIWEIPIVAALLLYGIEVGVFIALINTTILIFAFPGALPTGPLYNFAAILSMLLGITITEFLLGKHSPKNEALSVALFTSSGIILRASVMALMNWALLRFPPPVGYGMPEEAIIATVPLVVIFNITLALYTIPIGYSLAKIVESYVKTL